MEAFDDVGIQLCGGMNSGTGGSFRGKVYADVVEHVSGVSLYEEWIPPDVVRAMAEAFDRCDPEAVEREMADAVSATSAFEVHELRSSSGSVPTGASGSSPGHDRHRRSRKPLERPSPNIRRD